jgi:flagellar hook-associated protein 2
VGDLLSRINASDAGVTAAYDSGNDRFTLTNATTGDSGMTITDSSGLLAALGLTTGSGGGFTHGLDAQFTVNGGSMLTSSSNTLGAAAHGIAGLTVVVNTATEQTLQVSSDSKAMGDYIADFMTKFNQVQDLIDEHTKITVTGAAVTTAVLAGNREVEAWARELRALAFEQVSGLTGDVTRLDDLGIDFSSTTNHLTIKDADKLARALGDSADDVQDFFLTANTGLVAKMYTRLTSVISADSSQQSNLGKGNISIDEQVARLQTRLAAQREQLTTAFMKMLDAQSAAQSQNKTLTNAFSPKSSNN